MVELWRSSRDHHDSGLRIGSTWHQSRLNVPTFSGFGQFSLNILSLGKQADAPRFQQRICLRQQFGKRRQRARGHNIDRCPVRALTKSSIRSAWTTAGAPVTCAASRRNAAFLVLLSTRWTWRPAYRPARRRSPGRESRRRSRDRPRFSRSGASSEKLQRIGDVAGPKDRLCRRRDQIDPLLPVQQQRDKPVEAGSLFHVKQASAPDARPRVGACEVRRRHLRASGLAAGLAMLPAHMRNQQRQRRRRDAVDAAGMADGARPMCICSLWRTSLERPGSVA